MELLLFIVRLAPATRMVKLCRLVGLGSVGAVAVSGGLLGVARHVELGEKEEQRQDVPGVDDHDAGRVRGAPVWREDERG